MMGVTFFLFFSTQWLYVQSRLYHTRILFCLLVFSFLGRASPF